LSAREGGSDTPCALQCLVEGMCVHKDRGVCVGEGRRLWCWATNRLTEDHKPHLPHERNRIEEAGGRLDFQRCWRVVVSLAMGARAAAWQSAGRLSFVCVVCVLVAWADGWHVVSLLPGTSSAAAVWWWSRAMAARAAVWRSAGWPSSLGSVVLLLAWLSAGSTSLLACLWRHGGCLVCDPACKKPLALPAGCGCSTGRPSLSRLSAS
jgi:hypothetical protein